MPFCTAPCGDSENKMRLPWALVGAQHTVPYKSGTPLNFLIRIRVAQRLFIDTTKTLQIISKQLTNTFQFSTLRNEFIDP